MNKKFTKLIAALALLVFMMPSLAGWGQVVSGTTYTTSSTSFPDGWTKDGDFSGNYLKLIKTSNYIQTSNFTQNGFTSIVVNVRTFGGTSGNSNRVTITWYDASTNTPTELGYVTASSNSLTNKTLSNPANPTGNTTGYLKFECKNATGSMGCGVGAVTINYTAGTTNPTYSLTDESGENGSISFSASPVEAGTHVTLTPTPASAAYYFVENSWSFSDEGLVDVTENIEFVQGEANTIVMPAYNLLVDATFAAKPTFAITCVNDAHGLLTASPTSAYEGQTVTLSYIPETGYRLASIVITKTSDSSTTDITPTASGDDFTFEMPGYAVTATATFEEIPTHTITFNAGTGTCDTETMTGYEGSSITLPTAEPSYGCGQAGWTFIGWATAEITETTTAPTTLTGSYTITGDATLYAVYRDIVIGSVNTSNVFSNGSYNNSIITWTVPNIVSIKQERNGSGNTEPNSSYVSSPRWYTGNKITITPSVNINSITITASSESYANALANSTYTNASASADGTEVTITPTNGSSAITIVMGGQSRPSSLIVNYATSTTYYNTTPDCVMQYELTLPSNAEVLLFDSDENWIDVENGTALIEGDTEVRVSIDHVADCQLFESLSINPESGTVTVDEIGTGYYSFIMPSCNATIVVSTTPATHYTLNIVKPSQVSFEGLLVGWDSDDVITDFPASICEQASVLIDGLSVSSGYFLKSVTLTYGDETVELNKEIGVYSFTMPAANATLTFEVRDAASYTLVTSTEQLVSGKHYIIASSKEAGNAKAMSYDRGNNRYAEDVTVSTQNDKISIAEVNGLYEFAISGDEDNYTIYDKNEKSLNVGNTYGYLHSTNGSSNNYLKTTLNLTSVGDNGYWTFEFDEEGGNAIITAQAGTNNTIRYNSSSSLFSCYESTKQAKIYLYVKDDDTNLEFYCPTSVNSLSTANGEVYTVKNGSTLTITGTSNHAAANLIIEDGGQLFASSQVAATVQKNIVAHGATPADGGWNFIASPVAQNLTSNVLTGSGADLYYYEEASHMWRNYKIDDNLGGFDFANGKGYLYANSANTTLSFAGLQQPSNVSVTVPADNLSCAADVLTGFNLVGNPFPCKATLNRDYYAVNGSGLEAKTAEVVLDPCAGAMVQVSAENKVVTFTRVEPTTQQTSQPNQLQMTVAQQVMSRGTATSMVNDNAIINFNAGSRLEKFAFNADAAKLYIPQNGKDYAIVSAEAQGEMPLNFRANTDGQYVLTVNPEGVEMNYLHLIDNMTGNDVDLLATPSYTFNAKTTDYESRFRLVFAANNENGVSAGSTTFAYFSNGSLVVNNEGNATLQVVDVMGRIVKSESINGSANINVNAAPGVYTLRLVNGNDVKTQKVVVR